MEKNRLLLVPFFAGLGLFVYSWFLTYPLSTSSSNDFIFNHVSVLYWLSLPLLLVPMFLIAVSTKNIFLKWMLSIGIVLTFFSLSYFYFMMPTPDSLYIRSLTEYFIKTKSLDASQINHFYYQWPAYFVLADIVTSVSGLSVVNYEFLLYAIIAFLLSTGLYVYGFKRFGNGGVFVVVAFFISITDFLNYQAVPFSLALGLLFLVFMLGTRQESNGLVVVMLVLFAGIMISHLFVPLFLVLYLLIRSLFEKNSQNKRLYRNLFLITLVSYFLVQFTLAQLSFDQIVRDLIKPPIESLFFIASYSVNNLVSNPIYETSQLFSRTVIIGFIIMCIVGFIILLIKRRTNAMDKAILLSGILYAGLGIVLNTLGWRAGAIAFVPISLGVAFLCQGKFKKYFTGLFSVLLAIALFVPLIHSFNTDIYFQTKESYTTDNFFLDHYNWTKPGFVAADYSTSRYLDSKLSSYIYFQDYLDVGDKPDSILYSGQFVGSELANYSSMESLSQGQRLDILYNDGISTVLIKPS